MALPCSPIHVQYFVPAAVKTSFLKRETKTRQASQKQTECGTSQTEYFVTQDNDFWVVTEYSCKCCICATYCMDSYFFAVRWYTFLQKIFLLSFVLFFYKICLAVGLSIIYEILFFKKIFIWIGKFSNKLYMKSVWSLFVL